MKKILITQRVDYIASYDEHRDALDQRWVALMLAAELLPIPVANNMLLAEQLLALEQFDGLLLTGGNSLVEYGGDCEARDQVERYLLEWAIRNQVPVLGVCRGMQLIQHYYGALLQSIPDHVAVKKNLHILSNDPLSRSFGELGPVSVFHQLGTRTSSAILKTMAKTDDDVIMAVRHEILPVYGVMWHPERELHLTPNHIKYLKLIFDGDQ